MKRMLGLLSLVAAATTPLSAQSFPTDDPVIRAIWQEGMPASQVVRLAQPLMDSIGPRLMGTPNIRAGHDWLVKTYEGWGIPARNEQYGTWKGWRQGWLHVDLMQPRVHTMEAYLLGWSPGTNGPVEADVVALPEVKTPAEFQAWLPNARGKFVLVSMGQPTCRPDSDWISNALPATWQTFRAGRAAADSAWQARLVATGVRGRDLASTLEAAGARGVFSNRWSNGYGVDKVFNAHATRIPEIDLSCEDYGLVFRLVQNNQHPRLRADAKDHMRRVAAQGDAARAVEPVVRLVDHRARAVVDVEEDGVVDPLRLLDALHRVADVDVGAWVVEGPAGQLAHQAPVPVEQRRGELGHHHLGVHREPVERGPRGEAQAEAAHQHGPPLPRPLEREVGQRVLRAVLPARHEHLAAVADHPLAVAARQAPGRVEAWADLRVRRRLRQQFFKIKGR